MKTVSNKLQQAAEEHKEPLEMLIPRMIEQCGSVMSAADALNVRPNAIWYWMKRNGYQLQSTVTLVKEPADAPRT